MGAAAFCTLCLAREYYRAGTRVLVEEVVFREKQGGLAREGHLRDKVLAFAADLLQRFGPAFSATAVGSPKETCKVRNAPM